MRTRQRYHKWAELWYSGEPSGSVAERFKALVLKTSNGQPFVSSNLTASANARFQVFSNKPRTAYPVWFSGDFLFKRFQSLLRYMGAIRTGRLSCGNPDLCLSVVGHSNNFDLAENRGDVFALQ